jgi:BA14K-like protein
MTDMQAHLRKIRSDAAECLVLSNLAPEGKRELFARIGEHLNALALEVEKAIALNGTDMALGANHQPVAAVDHKLAPAVNYEPVANGQPAARSWRMYSLLFALVLVVIAGAPFFVLDRAERNYHSVTNIQSNIEPPRLPLDETKQAVAALLSGEQEERKVLTEKLDAIATRVDNLERAVNNLDRSPIELGGPPGKQSVDEKSPARAEVKPSSPEESAVRAEEKRTSTLEKPTSAEGNNASQSDGATPPANTSIAVDRVGTISDAKRAEVDLSKPTIGPRGCTHFRSFDPVSGTYMTFDGRRRQCR